MKAFSWVAIGSFFGFLFGHSVGAGRGTVTPSPPECGSTILIHMPAPESPTGTRILYLRVRRVAGGPEGLVEYAPSEYEDGALKVDKDREVVVVVGRRSYLAEIVTSP